jgi:gas vesicle protein
MANNQSGTILVAFIAGAVAGAAVALLFAPATGDETREYLGQRAREGRSKAVTAFEKAREQYQKAAEAAEAAEREQDA